MFWIFVSWQPAASSVSVGALGCTNLNILNLNLVFSIWSCRYPQSSGNMWAARCGYVAKLMDPKKLVSAMETTPGTRRGYAWCVGRRTAWTCAVAVRLVTMVTSKIHWLFHHEFHQSLPVLQTSSNHVSIFYKPKRLTNGHRRVAFYSQS